MRQRDGDTEKENNYENERVLRKLNDKNRCLGKSERSASEMYRQKYKKVGDKDKLKMQVLSS